MKFKAEQSITKDPTREFKKTPQEPSDIYDTPHRPRPRNQTRYSLKSAHGQ
jgi:hypothetical protein